MPVSQKTFRVFVSSTFTDMRAERRVLQETVFPRLKALCESRGTSFQAVDLRWGVNEEAQLDQKTMDICLNEIHRCQKLSPKPNFIILLGDRYGWQPVPGKIPSSEMDEILTRLPDNEKDFIENWYKKDLNAVPSEHVLQPREGEYEDYNNWRVVEDRLREILRESVMKTNFTEEQRVKYFASATHQEIIRGALNPPEGVIDPEEHVFAYLRTMRNLPENIEAKDFIDLSGNSRDQYAKDQLKKLRTDLNTKLRKEHIYEYEAEWEKKCKVDDIEAFGERVYSDLETIIKAQFEEIAIDDPAVKEIKLHEEFRQQRLQHFTGRDEALKAIRDYLQGKSQKIFSIIGASGSGKTSIIAKAIEESLKNPPIPPLSKGGTEESSDSPSLGRERIEGDSDGSPLWKRGGRGDFSTNEEFPGVSVFRFIGTTSNTSDAFKLLTQIIRQITDQYGVEMNSLFKEGEDEKKFSTLHGLKELFQRCLSLASSEKPLIIFLDAFDQLSGDLSSLSLDWMPKELPENVRMVVSALPELRDRLSYTEVFELNEMSEEDASELLKKWLGSIRRTLQDNQRNEVINKFTANGTPLYLRLAFEKAKNWRSYTTNTVLKEDIDGILGEYFDDLQKNHGELLVEKFCGYVLSGKYQGLTENELLDLFVFDPEYWPHFIADCHPDHKQEVTEMGKLPVIVWSRLFLDIEPYLTEKDADGVPIISFYHRKFIEYARDRYLHYPTLDNAPAVGPPSYFKRGKGELLSSYHNTLADYFEKAPLYLDEKEKVPNVRKVVEQPYQQTMGGQWEDVADKTLANFPFLMSKTKADMVEGILNDYHFTFASAPQETKEKLNLWEAFFRERMHILRRRNDEWPAYKILLQLAVEHADDSPITQGSEQYLKDGKVDWAWIRRMQRVKETGIDPCSAVLEGHTDFIRGALELKDGRILSWSSDNTLRLWDRGGALLKVLERHKDRVEGALELRDGRILSRSWDNTLRIWDKEGRSLKVFDGHTKGVDALELRDGRILSWSWGDKTLRIWDIKGSQETVLKGHTGSVHGALELKDGRILSWSEDNTRRIWNKEGKSLRVLEGHADTVEDALELKDGRILSWSWDNTLRLWNKEGRSLKVLEGHKDRVEGALELTRIMHLKKTYL